MGRRELLPPSPTSMNINVMATLIFICGLYFVKWENIDAVKGAVFSMLILALAIMVPEWIFLRTYKRSTTGLDFSRRNAFDWRRLSIKILGLYGTIGFVALVYWLFPVYRSGYYSHYWIFIRYVAYIIIIAGIPYLIIIDKFMIQPRDGFWHFGMLLLAGWKKIDRKMIQQHLLGWVVKLFFLPLMFCSLVININYIKNNDFVNALRHFPYLYDYILNMFFTIDLAFVSVGYLMSFRLLDNQIRTTEPTILGWMVALQCYEPFWNFSYTNYLRYNEDLIWTQLWFDHPLIYKVWGMAIIFLIFIYVWATVAFGLRFSNLTNRGILTNGPYRFCKHPAYVSKNLSWWLIAVPFISRAGSLEAIRNCILLFLLNVIYYLRAMTEERHLSQDPNYVAYGLAMNKLSVFRWLYAIFPFLKYDPEKYRAQLDDYSAFIPDTNRDKNRQS